MSAAPPRTIQRTRQRDIAIEMTLVKLIENHCLQTAECGVFDQLPKQNPFGFKLDARGIAGRILKPDLIADFTSKVYAQLLCHP